MTDDRILTAARSPKDNGAAPRSTLAPPAKEYIAPMTYHNVLMPPALQAWVDARIAEGRYADVTEYLRDLVRQDARSGDERAWLRGMIDEGLASGVIDRDPREIIQEIIAEDPDLRD